MEVTLLFLVAGGLLVFMALAGTSVKRLPLSPSMVYLAVGYLLGPSIAGLIHLDPVEDAPFLERVAELAVLVSLFTAGLKLRVPLSDRRWFIPLRLAFLSMAVTIGLIAAVGIVLFGLSPGAAILLGALLAPTDPVLASDVQVAHPFDRDRTRFTLTGEAGLNDGSAFPFVLLGLGLLQHDFTTFALHWVVVDLLWASLGGLGIGWGFGSLVGYLVVYLRREHKEALGLDDFLALGLIALSYGAALLVHTYGFLAVFASGLAMRRLEQQHSGDKPPDEVLAATRAGEEKEIATHPEKGPAYMTQAVLAFNEHMERIGEMVIVVFLGSMLSMDLITSQAMWLVPLLLLVIRPVATFLGLLGSDLSRLQFALIAWFGIRGVGSIYYVMFAIQKGLPEAMARQLAGLTLITVTASIILHGISVTPLMTLYERRRKFK